jgi:hypothetical protein
MDMVKLILRFVAVFVDAVIVIGTSALVAVISIHHLVREQIPAPFAVCVIIVTASPADVIIMAIDIVPLRTGNQISTAVATDIVFSPTSITDRFFPAPDPMRIVCKNNFSTVVTDTAIFVKAVGANRIPL